MSLLVVGMNHNSADEIVRERIVFDAGMLPDAYSDILDHPDITEAVILSTCNRCEIYLDMKQDTTALDDVGAFLASFHGLSRADSDTMRECLYLLSGRDMVAHLFSVVSSLDSQVLGETQIVSQVKDAYQAALDAGACRETFRRLFQQAFEVGKRVRTETEIGTRSVSISTSAVDLALKTFGTLEDRRVCVIGAGKMGEIACRYLLDQGAREVRVVNRTFAAAERLADRMGGIAVPFSDLPDVLSWADIVISATAAPGFVITPETLNGAEWDGGRELLLIDIALPRDIDPECRRNTGVSLYNLDDLLRTVEGNREAREREIALAMSIVDEGIAGFLVWMQERETVPTISHIYEKMERVCDQEVVSAIHEMEVAEGRPLTNVEVAVLEKLARGVGRKIVHGPTIRLRRQAADADSYRYTDAARYLFGLDTSPLGRRCRTCTRARECRRSEGGPCLVAVDEGDGL